MSAQQYLAPTTLAQALAWRAAHPRARWLAGGTDVLVQLRQQPANAEPAVLMDITRLPELHGIWVDAGWLHLGAASSFAQIAASPLVATHASALQQAALTVGGPAIRNMGTLGGNLCSASPAADALPPLVVLQAQVELTSLAGTRCLPVADFVTGPHQTRLGAGELLTRISLPLLPNAGVQRFAKIGLRQSLAIAVVSLAGLLVFDVQGRITLARFAWGSVGPVVQRIPELEALFIDQTMPVPPSLLREALQLVQQNVHPISDLRASADYRRAMAAQLLADFLATSTGLTPVTPAA